MYWVLNGQTAQQFSLTEKLYCVFLHTYTLYSQGHTERNLKDLDLVNEGPKEGRFLWRLSDCRKVLTAASCKT
ncbi:hypothetical protein C0J52_01009 [Blattella germanica]|nr:hypothetical protein C0J52_01009 [Blattella germanica]